jgi:hypothetical protein
MRLSAQFLVHGFRNLLASLAATEERTRRSAVPGRRSSANRPRIQYFGLLRSNESSCFM